MIRGISLKIVKRFDNLLEVILGGINISTYNWYNIESQEEAWSLTTDGECEFLENIHYSGKEFKNHVSKNHFIIFLKLEAYLKDTKHFDIRTYEEFQDSDCEILILIYDCKNIEIFVKDANILQNIYESVREQDFAEIDFITDKNDERVILEVR